MKKTRVYIDGYNLYYGLLKGTLWKWLDLELFSKGLLNPDHDIRPFLFKLLNRHKTIFRHITLTAPLIRKRQYCRYDAS